MYFSSMRLPDEAIAIANRDADLAERPRHGHGGDESIGRRLRAAHDLDQPHHIGGREKVHAEHVAGPGRKARDLVDIEGRGVGGE